MQNQRSDEIWEAVVDKALGDPRPEVDYAMIMAMELEDAFNYLTTGALPKGFV